MSVPRIAIFGSGNGSNMQAIVDTMHPHRLKVAAVFCDQPNAKLISRAAQAHIPCTFPEDTRWSDTELWQHAQSVLSQPLDLVVLAGFMRIIPDAIIQRHASRVLNIHPSLLPAYRGKDALQRAHEAGESQVGVTVHVVVPEVDAGPILAQVAIDVRPGESVHDLEQRIHAVEHILYPATVEAYLKRGSFAAPQPFSLAELGIADKIRTL